MADYARKSKYEMYLLFHNYIRPMTNDVGLWELYEIICDEIEERQEELFKNGVSADDFRLSPIPRRES